MSVIYLDFIKVPSSIPKRAPIVLVYDGKQVMFNAIKDNGNGFDLLMEYEPYSLIADRLTLSKDAKHFLEQGARNRINERSNTRTFTRTGTEESVDDTGN